MKELRGRGSVARLDNTSGLNPAVNRIRDTATVVTPPPALHDVVHGVPVHHPPPTGLLVLRSGPGDATRSTLQLSGEVDPSGAGLLTATLAEELVRGHRIIRLDLSRTVFLDWAGLRVLARAHNQCLAAGGTLVLSGLSRSLTWLLSLTQLDQVLVIADKPAAGSRPTPLTLVVATGPSRE